MTRGRPLYGMLRPARALPENIRDAAGRRQTRRARSTGTLVSVYDGEPAGLDTDGGRWQTVCEDHGTICSHETLALARAFASIPEEWCETCMGNEDPA